MPLLFHWQREVRAGPFQFPPIVSKKKLAENSAEIYSSLIEGPAMSSLGSEASPAHAVAEPPVQPTDGSLLRRFQRGNEDAAALLYSRYSKRLQALARRKCSPNLARRLEAEDIVLANRPRAPIQQSVRHPFQSGKRSTRR